MIVARQNGNKFPLIIVFGAFLKKMFCVISEFRTLKWPIGIANWEHNQSKDLSSTNKIKCEEYLNWNRFYWNGVVYSWIVRFKCVFIMIRFVELESNSLLLYLLVFVSLSVTLQWFYTKFPSFVRSVLLCDDDIVAFYVKIHFAFESDSGNGLCRWNIRRKVHMK